MFCKFRYMDGYGDMGMDVVHYVQYVVCIVLYYHGSCSLL